MNIVKTNLFIFTLGLSLVVGNVKAGPVVNGAAHAGRVIAKNVADISKAFFSDSTKAYFEALKANLLASNHPLLANHPYATFVCFSPVFALLGGVIGAGVGAAIEKIAARRALKGKS